MLLFKSLSPNSLFASFFSAFLLALALDLFLFSSLFLLGFLSVLSGASFKALIERPIFSSSGSMLKILTSTSSPTFNSSDGFST